MFIDSDEKVEHALTLLEEDGWYALDTETSDLDSLTGTLWSIQIAKRDGFAVMFPFSALSEESRNLIREWLRDKSIICHNAKFDYKWIKRNGFDVKDIYCTMVSEQCLYAGKYFTFDLKSVVHRRYQVAMDKEDRKDFYDGTFASLVEEFGHWGAWQQSPQLIQYGLDDVSYLFDIQEEQIKEASQIGSQKVLGLENSIIKTVADMELRGIWINEEELAVFRDEMVIRRDELNEEIMSQLTSTWDLLWRKEYKELMKRWDDWQVAHREVVKKSNKLRGVKTCDCQEECSHPLDNRKKTEKGKEMVEKSLKNQPFSTKPKEENEFNPNSYIKLRKVLSEIMGVPTSTTAKDWMEENVNLHPILESILEQRKYEKLCQFTLVSEDINPATGRIHSNFNQSRARTGRFSCDSPNLQNVPIRSDDGARFRALFQPQNGKYVGADFSGIELVILAELSKEQNLIDAINQKKDLHINTMSLFLGCAYSVLKEVKDAQGIVFRLDEVEEARKRFDSMFALTELKGLDITAWVLKLRDYTKTLTYGIVYGLSEYGLSRKFHCSLQDAKEFIKLFFKAYPTLEGYLKLSGELGLIQGWNATPLGRRRWFTKPRKKSYEEVEKEVIAEFKRQKRLTDSVSNKEWVEAMDEGLKNSQKEYNSKINGIKRMSANCPIQGCVSGNTYILTKEYGIKKIFELEGYSITVWDGFQWSKAFVKRSGLKQKVILKLSGREEIECSPDHRFLMSGINSDNYWKEAKDIKVGNRIIHSDTADEWDCETYFPDYKQEYHAPNSNLKFMEDFTGSKHELGVVLGRLASDGSVNVSGRVSWFIAEHEFSIYNYIKELVLKFGCPIQEKVTQKKNQKLYSINFHSKSLALQLQSLKKRVPTYLLSSKDLLVGYLSGYFDGDGTCSKDGVSCKFGRGRLSYAKQVQRCLSMLGIKSGLSLNSYSTGVFVYKNYTEKFNSVIGFLNPLKQYKASLIEHKPTKTVKKNRIVKSVEITDEYVEMFDVVNSETEMFMANGVVTHNCSADMIKLSMYYFDREYYGDGGLVLTVHDELIAEVPDEWVEEASEVLKASMERAGKDLCPNMLIEVDVKVSDKWTK